MCLWTLAGNLSCNCAEYECSWSEWWENEEGWTFSSDYIFWCGVRCHFPGVSPTTSNICKHNNYGIYDELIAFIVNRPLLEYLILFMWLVQAFMSWLRILVKEYSDFSSQSLNIYIRRCSFHAFLGVKYPQPLHPYPNAMGWAKGWCLLREKHRFFRRLCFSRRKQAYVFDCVRLKTLFALSIKIVMWTFQCHKGKYIQNVHLKLHYY